MLIKARSFYPKKIADVKFGIKEVLTRGDMIYGNFTLRDNFGNCLISGGMVYLTATIDGEPVQPNESVLLRIPANKLDTAMKVYKTNDSTDSPAWELAKIDMNFVDIVGRQYYEFNIPVFSNYNCDHPSLIGSVVVPAISAVEAAIIFVQKIIGEKGIVIKSKKMKYGRAYITSKEILTVTRAKLISEKKASFRLEENDCIKDEKIYVGIFSKNGQSYYVYKPLADIKYKRFVNRYVLRKSDYIPKTDEEIEAIIASL